MYSIVHNCIQLYTTVYNCIPGIWNIYIYIYGSYHVGFIYVHIYILKEERRGGARRHAGRKGQQVELPEGWDVRYKVRKTGSTKGKRERYFVTPGGTFLRSKQEMEAHLYLDSLSERRGASTSREQPRASTPRNSRRFCAGVAK